MKKNKKNGRNLYYEVIFENDKGTGFSLLSADERVDKLLCYSENGSISDTSFNKSLKYCLELVDLYVEGQTQKELDIESLASSANQKIKAANKGKVITKALPPFDPDDPNSPWSYDRTDVKTKSPKGSSKFTQDGIKEVRSTIYCHCFLPIIRKEPIRVVLW